MRELELIRQLAESAARDAGAYISEHVGKLKEVSFKGEKHNLVTDVDLASEKIIKDKIRTAFPGHSILAEEGGAEAGGAEYTWIIDPIDGTTNFAHGFPVFCVSVAVKRAHKIEVGVIYDPSRQELFSAVDANGAFLNGERINVSSSGKVADSLLSTGFAYASDEKMDNLRHFEKMLRHSQAVRRPGSAAIDLCCVACGRFDGFWEMSLNPWDTAAGILLVKEAGGKVTDLSGNEFDIFDGDVLATNGRIHQEMVELLN